MPPRHPFLARLDVRTALHVFEAVTLHMNACFDQDMVIENNFFDASVTIETFEHLDKTSGKKFLENIAKWTKPGGIVFISSPMLRYKDGKPYVTNPFHINEMPRDQFIKLINS